MKPRLKKKCKSLRPLVFHRFDVKIIIKKNYNQVTLLIKKNREQFIYNLAIFMLSHMVKTIYLIIGSYEDGLLGLLLMIFL